MILASFLWLVAGVYQLGRVAFTPLVGAIAALLLLTRFDFAFLAARGYIDIPYMAMSCGPRRSRPSGRAAARPSSLLLAAAGLLRPEAWLLAAFYWLLGALGRRGWASASSTRRWPRSARSLWAATDFAVTGDPLFSLHYTSSSAEELGRQLPLSELPSAIPAFFANLVKLPVLVAAVLGLAIADPGRAAPRGGAAGAADGGDRDLRADRDRRRLGHRALPGVAALALLVFVGRLVRRLTMFEPGGCGRRGGDGGAVALLGSSSRPPRQPRPLRRRAELPRRRARRPRRGPRRPAGAGGRCAAGR